MNSLLQFSKRTVLLNNRLPIQTAVRTVLNNKDWRPNEEVPVTTEDRAATARKYNMLPEDYKTLPAERNAGDMPNVEPAGAYSERSPWEDYDYPLARQNWNEPRHPLDHVKYDKYRVPHSHKTAPNYSKDLLKLLAFPALFIITVYLLRDVHFMNPTFRSPRVQTGVVHYSFEKDDGSGQGVRY